jgi:hypothetical protein
VGGIGVDVDGGAAVVVGGTGVAVGVAVGVLVGVPVGLGVDVGVSVGVAARVGVGVDVAVGGSGAVGDGVLGDAGAQPTATSRHSSKARTALVRTRMEWVMWLLRFNV